MVDPIAIVRRLLHPSSSDQWKLSACFAPFQGSPWLIPHRSFENTVWRGWISTAACAEPVNDRHGRRGVRLTIDLSEVRFMDAAGLRVLLETRREALEAGDELSPVCERPELLKLFELTGLDRA